MGFFAREIGGELGDAALQLDFSLAGALFLALERLAGENQPLQGGASLGFGVAQSGQGVGGQALGAGGFGLDAGAFGEIEQIRPRTGFARPSLGVASRKAISATKASWRRISAASVR